MHDLPGQEGERYRAGICARCALCDGYGIQQPPPSPPPPPPSLNPPPPPNQLYPPALSEPDEPAEDRDRDLLFQIRPTTQTLKTTAAIPISHIIVVDIVRASVSSDGIFISGPAARVAAATPSGKSYCNIARTFLRRSRWARSIRHRYGSVGWPGNSERHGSARSWPAIQVAETLGWSHVALAVEPRGRYAQIPSSRLRSI